MHSSSALLTDLYQLTMMQAAFTKGMNERAAFELFIRRLPAGRNFLLAAGLPCVLDYLRALRFTQEDLDWLGTTGYFSQDFLASLADFRFTGDVFAIPEGTAVFPDEPLVRIEAPWREAQLVESRVMNLLHYSTLCASKAARCVLAAQGRTLVDFGLRRSHGAEAGLLSARASYIAGFAATATTLAGKLYGIPVAGSMAHSFVQAHDHESDAMLAMLETLPPPGPTLLIDTYDTQEGARKVVRLAAALKRGGRGHIRAVRIDSGDLAEEACKVRAILDAGDCSGIRIMASGELDEFRLQALLGAGAPIDEFGVGTRMNTSSDAPFLDCAYKLVEYAGSPRRKTSSGKAQWPGRKQVWRRRDANGRLLSDVLGLADETLAGTPLLQPVMRGGQLLQAESTLAQVQARVREELLSLPPALRSLEAAPAYPVEVSAGLVQLTHEVDIRLQLRAGEDRLRTWPAPLTSPST